jgi:hypothetical protein
VNRAADRFALSADSESPRCVEWNAHCRDFVAKSRPAGGTYQADLNRRDVLGGAHFVATLSPCPARQAGPTRRI